MIKCTSILGHSYQARYDLIPPVDMGFQEGSIAGIIKIIEAATKVVYVCDVCKRCGHVIDREPRT